MVGFRLGWRVSYYWYGGWHGGWVLCKVLNMGLIHCELLSSAILASIGLDRFFLVLQPFVSPATAQSRVKIMISISWIYSMVISMPQLLLYDTVVDANNNTQCGSMIYIARQLNLTSEPMWGRATQYYKWVHWVAVFGAPMAVITVCYGAMMQQVCRYLVCAADDLSDRDRRRPMGDPEPSTTRQKASVSAMGAPGGSKQMARTAEQPTATTSRVPLVRAATRSSTLQRNTTLSSLPGSAAGGPRSWLSRMGTESSLRMAASAAVDFRPAGSVRTSLKMLKTAFILVTVYIITWTPFSVVILLTELKFNLHWLNSVGNEVGKDLIILNSLINPLLYGFTRKDVRHSVRKLKRWCRCIGRALACFFCICCKLFTYDWDESSD